jgi:hypothetical protein
MKDDTNPAKRKPGRKPKSEDEKAGAPILVRATPAERRAIHGRAAAAGRSLSRYLVAVGTRDQPPATEDERVELSKLLFEIHKAGVNLNQIAARLHQQTGMISTAEIERAIAEIRAAARAVKEKIKI